MAQRSIQAMRMRAVPAPAPVAVDIANLEVPERWWTVEDVMTRLKCSRERVYYYIKQRKLPFRKVGRYYEFHPALIDRWELEQLTVL